MSDVSPVVINEFDVVGVAVDPDEADTELLIHADRMLAGTVALELLQHILRRGTKVSKIGRAVQHAELSTRDFQKVGRKALSAMPSKAWAVRTSLKLTIKRFAPRHSHSIAPQSMSINE